MADLQKFKTDCEYEGGTWINTCPNGEKVTCIYEEDEYDKDVLYKIYVEDYTCGDLMMKNTNGSEDIVQKGGACGPFEPEEDVPLLMCTEFPELPTKMINLSCVMEGFPFVIECPSNANLSCYLPKEKAIFHIYGEMASSFTCESLGMENL
jgi:hypothetical protein